MENKSLCAFIIFCLVALVATLNTDVDELNSPRTSFVAEVMWLGVMLRDMPKNIGGRPAEITGDKSEPVTEPTLADIGIDKRTSSRAQKLAALPEKVFAQVASGDMPVAHV